MEYLQVNGSTLLWFGVALLTTVLYLKFSRRRKLPPGPTGFPILGYYPFLRKDPLKTLKGLGQKYGSIYGFHMGPRYLVILNDWDALVDAYSRSSCLSRPAEFYANVPYNFGMIGSNGLEWSEVRRLASRAMKDIGLNKTRWEQLIQEEVSEITDRILQHDESPLDLRNLLSDTFTNNIMTLVLGERLPFGHPVTRKVTEGIDTLMEYSSTLEMMNFSPRLRRVLQMLGLEKKYLMKDNIEEFAAFVSDTVDEKVQNSEKESEDSFIDQFHGELLQNEQKFNDHSTDFILKGNVVALLTGGSDTTRTTVIWLLIAMADHPETQRKVHEELDRVIGKDGSVIWADRFKIPYTYASILEILRWKTIGPLPLMRMVTEDMPLQGYIIPKGTFMVSNTCAIHEDTRYWKEPEKFIPERFLLEDGKKVNSAPDSYTPFSYGKRNCPGKLIAMMEIMQYFSSLMQKFKVVPKDGKKVKYDILYALTYQAANVELCFIPRQ